MWYNICIMYKSKIKLIDNRPDLIKQLHPTKNSHLDISTIGLYSNKPAIWVCDKCNYEYSMIIANKTKHNQNCPACSGKVATSQNNLAIKYPELLKEWDWEENDRIGLDPYRLLPFSNRKAKWKCLEKGHKWPASIYHRTHGEQNCPYCSNNKVCIDNCLATIRPDLLEEWDWEKNIEYSPYEVLPNARKSPYWKCKRGHKYQMRLDHRMTGHGCKYCNNQDSKLQLFLFSEIKYYYPNAIYKYKIDRSEIDIYLMEHKIGIELSGYHWHKSSLDADKNKAKLFDAKGITIINVRENGLAEINENTVRYNKKDSPLSISKNMMICLYNIIKDERLKEYQDIKIPVNELAYLNDVAKYPAPPYEKSLEFLAPKLSLEWDYERNGNLKPSDVHAMSNSKFHWKCPVCKHKWTATPDGRYRLKHGCPNCWSIRRKKQTIL